MRLMVMVVLSLVVVAAGVVVGCGGGGEKALQKVNITLSQYLKGATGDFDDATINSAAEGAGEGGVNTMFMAFTPSTSGLPKGTKYENLTSAQKDAVQASAAAFFDSVQAGIDAGTPLTQNPAYVMLHNLQALSWMGLWADPFQAWDPADAFWKVWPDPVGRGAKVEYLDAKAKAAYAGKEYAQITAAERAVLDTALAAFLATMQTQVTAANADVTAKSTPAYIAAMVAAGAHKTAADAADDIEAALISAGVPAALAAAAKAAAEPNYAYAMSQLPELPAADVAMVVAVAVGGVILQADLQTMDAFPVLQGVNLAAAEGWKTDVTASVHPVQAFKRWMVKPALLGLTGMGLLIQLSVAEFTFKITNPNDYDVSIDTIDFNASCNANGFGYYTARDVDAAKMALHDAVWVPANGSIDLHMIVPMKTLDMLTWLIVGPGLDSTTAGTYAADVWGKMKAGTAVWNVTIVTSQSHVEETIPDATYTLTWTPAVS
jgi:hypothetical protein